MGFKDRGRCMGRSEGGERGVGPVSGRALAMVSVGRCCEGCVWCYVGACDTSDDIY